MVQKYLTRDGSRGNKDCFKKPSFKRYLLRFISVRGVRTYPEPNTGWKVKTVLEISNMISIPTPWRKGLLPSNTRRTERGSLYLINGILTLFYSYWPRGRKNRTSRISIRRWETLTPPTVHFPLTRRERVDLISETLYPNFTPLFVTLGREGYHSRPRHRGLPSTPFLLEIKTGDNRSHVMVSTLPPLV